MLPSRLQIVGWRMLWIILVIPVILSLLSVVSSYTLCRFVHLELVVLPIDLITGRRHAL